MESEDKVFSSDIERGQKPLNNNLYDLLQFVPAQPIKPKLDQDNHCAFRPQTDKNYIPKKRHKFSKVKTVRDLRREYEEECQSYLPEDVCKTENYVFASIRRGSLRRDKTLRLANTLMKGDSPLSRSTWQMLTNINPDKHNHSTQCVLWNGTRIRVSGSKGGERKFLCNYDLAKKKIMRGANKSKTMVSANTLKSLLKTLSVDFKPGPLSRKRLLDKSYQKYNVGECEVVELPKVGLEIQPLLGVPIEPTISDILTSNRQDNDRITENWALFAVSTLGSVHDSGINQVNIETVTFGMSYSNSQGQILMRRDLDTPKNPVLNHERQTADRSSCESIAELKTIIEDMLNAVEISLNQDDMYTGVDEPRVKNENETHLTTAIREKPKKKLLELQKLDVTVIRLSDSPAKEILCTNTACTWGCICSSLKNEYKLKNHCGRFECMFQCKCDFTHYKVSSNIDDTNTEFIPGLLNLDSKINCKLAKEEKKFHQTVFLTQNDSILLKAKRRSLKTPKRYAEFIKDIPKQSDQDLSIIVPKMDCKNVEPWCMIHNLYKCFCKGRFTDCLVVREEPYVLRETKSESISPPKTENDESLLKSRKDVTRKSSVSSSGSNSDVIYESTVYISSCARTKAFTDRKHDGSYYRKMNSKINEMEANDSGLQSKLLAHLKQNNSEKNLPEIEVIREEFSFIPEKENTCAKQQTVTQIPKDPTEIKVLPNKAKLITWLEANYKHYKQRIENGQKHIPLEAPKLGKISLYPWEVILERYKLRKNYFLVTKEPPYRIYIAVNLKSPFLTNCVNIDQIPHNDLMKYPMTVKNLLGDTTDMRDNFYILCGLSHCWELVGSVTKLNNRRNSEQSDRDNAKSDTTPVNLTNLRKSKEKDDCSYSFENLDRDQLDKLLDSNDNKNESDKTGGLDSTYDKNETDKMDDFLDTNNKHEVDKVGDRVSSNDNKNKANTSKWFYMIIENDFSEIQFHSRGFFVKHENIIKAVNVARASGKTVRLSSQKFNQSSDMPQFGIYAIPYESHSCAFVGPYEKEDLLEMEAVMRTSYHTASRGVWITTNKCDNINVIDEPLLFLPQIKESEIITLGKTQLPTKRPCTDNVQDTKETVDQSPPSAKVSKPSTEKNPSPAKVVKPIRVRKFYHLTPEGVKTKFYKPVSLLRPLDKDANKGQLVLPSTASAVHEESYPIPIIQTTFSLSEAKNYTKSLPDQTKLRPIAEIAPQMKQYKTSPTVADSAKEPSTSRGMSILKPEQINQRLCENKLLIESNLKNTDAQNHLQDMDIENFLATSEICVAPTIESIIYVSDEDVNNLTPKIKDVWLECQNIPNIGCLKGKKDSNNEISFEFPGFKFTEFYPEDEAFTKINQVLSRKVYIPKQINLLWKVIEREEDVTVKDMLKASNLGPDYVLTASGLINKRDLIASNEKPSLMTSLDYLKQMVSPNELATQPLSIVEKATTIIKDLEEQSNILEHEHDDLQTESSLNKSKLLSLILQVPKELRNKVTETLRNFK